MSRISKEKAHKLAEFLTKGNFREQSKRETKLRAEAYLIAVSKLSEEIKSLMTTDDRKYINTRQGVCFKNGADENYFLTEGKLPSTGYNYHICELSKEEFKTVNKAIVDFNKFKKSNKILKDNLVEAIYALRTEKRVIDQFPNTAQLFEKKERFLPSNIDQLKSLIIKGDAATP